MTDQIIYADMPGCEEAEDKEGRSWCLLRLEFCNLIAVCPLGYVKEGEMSADHAIALCWFIVGMAGVVVIFSMGGE